MTVRAATPEDIIRVCGRLREVDREEQFARRRDDSAMQLAADLIALERISLGRFAFIGRDGEAETILAAYRVQPGVARVHRISTGAWVDVSRAVFLFGVKVFVPQVLAPQVARAECAVLAKHARAALMLQRLGFRPEGIDAVRGRQGEEFMNFGWSNLAAEGDHV